MTTFEDRLKFVERMGADLYIRLSEMNGKLEECLEMIRALEGKGDEASAVFRKLYPKTLGVTPEDTPGDKDDKK